MVTSIQIDERTLLLLKKLKQELNASSYDEAIVKIAVQRTKGKSVGGSLRKYLKKGETLANIIKELQEERRKSDRL